MRRYHFQRRGSVLIIVLWVAFGLVTLALYFANSMSLEMRAAENRSSAIQAEQAIAGAARYVSNILANVQERGAMPDFTTYQFEDVPVGEANFWFIGRFDRQQSQQQTLNSVPYFGLADEASKLNINVATREMLEALPGMTAELAAAIIDWRDADDEVTDGGAESQSYLRLSPAYRCKNSNFESTEELRLVAGAHLDLLYGEDVNMNGALDPNENDGEVSPPLDDRNGQLNPGFLEYLTVFSRQPAAGTNVSQLQDVAALLQQKFSVERANQILAQLAGAPVTSVLDFYRRSGMTREEFVQVEGELIGTNLVGLVNVNTAPEAVLACIPGIGAEKAPAMVAYRQSNPDKLNTVAWVTEVLEQDAVAQAASWLIGRTFQFCADVAAVGRHGRGYARVRYIFDTTEGAAKIVYRQDLTHAGWPLGPETRTILLARNAQ
jgi:type II secretory pathway component PulK